VAGPAPGELARRLQQEKDITSLGASFSPLKAKQIYYPRWMFGEWDVTSTFAAYAQPLGPRFVPPGAREAVRAAPEDGGLGSCVSYKLRFYSTLPDTLANTLRVQVAGQVPEDAVISDRAFNVKQSTNAFLGFDAVKSSEFDPRESLTRQTVYFNTLAPDFTPIPPSRFELYFENPRVEAPGEGVFITSELFRQVRIAPRTVETTDYEIVTRYTLVSPGRVLAQQRTILYLQPQDALYFEALGRATAIYDYECEYTRAELEGEPGVACVETPKGATQCV